MEKGIRGLGLKVDIMFLKPEAKLAAILENLSSQGTMFAGVIRAQHAANQSISIHVVQTPPDFPVLRKHEST